MTGCTSGTCWTWRGRRANGSGASRATISGEAARHVSAEFQREHPEVPWPAIIGMRHKIVHDYLSVDEDRVWRTATEELGELIDQLRALVPER
jgi:uncharacterized protein with HEPN domain